MPYASKAQQGLFHSPNSPVGPAEVKKFDADSKGQKGLPQHVPQKPKSPPRPGMAAARMKALRGY